MVAAAPSEPRGNMLQCKINNNIITPPFYCPSRTVWIKCSSCELLTLRQPGLLYAQSTIAQIQNASIVCHGMMCEAFYQRQLADVSAYTVLESHFFFFFFAMDVTTYLWLPAATRKKHTTLMKASSCNTFCWQEISLIFSQQLLLI